MDTVQNITEAELAQLSEVAEYSEAALLAHVRGRALPVPGVRNITLNLKSGEY
jgi:hypothetical protein